MRPRGSWVLLLLVAAARCGGVQDERRAATPEGAVPSALLVTLDATRADALGAYGGPIGLTPALDALAAEALVYEQARTVAPITLPAHASMLTGLYPPRHSARDDRLNAVPASAVTLAERAAERGIATAAFVSSVLLDARFGLDQGFAVYGTPNVRLGRPRSRVGVFEERSGHEVVADAVEWLAGLEPGERFFLWVHLFDPHAPYTPPPAALQRARGDAYGGEVAAADDAVASLLAALRESTRLDETFVVVVGDHGEGLGDHGEVTHGVFCYDTTLRVPFLVRYPDGYRAGSRSAEIVSVADVPATIAEALGLGASGDMDGVSLYRRKVAPGRGVYFESYQGTIDHGWVPIAGWVDGAGKYVHGQHAEFFDLARDPLELEPLALAELQLAPYRAALAAVLVQTPKASGSQSTPSSLGPAM